MSFSDYIRWLVDRNEEKTGSDRKVVHPIGFERDLRQIPEFNFLDNAVEDKNSLFELNYKNGGLPSPVCPYCGTKKEDSFVFSYPYEDREILGITCTSCGKRFVSSRQVYVFQVYRSYPDEWDDGGVV